jgi:uncharacterized protein YndB with AHSA1/START domain
MAFITVHATIAQPVAKVWQLWTTPEHICRWNNASDDWHTPAAINDLRAGGQFSSRMEARDGSAGFDFRGTHSEVKTHERIAYTIEDGRQVEIVFQAVGGNTQVTERFEAETVHPEELQRQGWQAILDNFKRYAETQ